MRVTVVVPTYNEADNIERLCREVRQSVPEAKLLIVDDASPDGTAAVAERLGEELGHISVLHRSGKAGLGAA
ncbi:MAG: glycosyltransferase, partial [Ilumatobacteraceae bacterium]